MHVVGLLAIDRHDVAQSLLIGYRIGADRALEVRQVLLGQADRTGIVLGDQIDDTVESLHRHRTDGGGFEHAEPASFDHGGPTHADVRSFECDHDVAAAEDGRVPREAIATGDTDERYQTRQTSEIVERPTVESGHAETIGVTRSTPATFGEEHHGKPQSLGDVEETILLAMVLLPLSSGQHRVVVRHHDCP